MIDFPSELSKSHWDKKKGALPAGGPLEARLKALQKKHESVDWSAFQPGWETAARSAEALEKAHAELDRAWRTSVMPLKVEANGAAEAAQKLAKEKGVAKLTLDAARAATDAVKAYAKAIDAGLAVLEQARASAASALKSGGGAAGPAAGGLFDPKLLLANLQLSRRDPERRMHFAFLSDGKAAPLFTLSPKVAARTLFATAQEEAGIKTGGYGRAWVDDTVLYLEVEKPFSGIARLVLLPLKAAGFKVTKVVLVGADGGEIDDGAAEAPTAGATAQGGGGTAPAPGAAPPAPGAIPPAPDDAPLRFAALLKKLGPAITAAITAGGRSGQEIRLLASEAGVLGRRKSFGQGLAVLGRIQRLLDGAGAAAAAPAAGTAPPTPKAAAQAQTAASAPKAAPQAGGAVPPAPDDAPLRFAALLKKLQPAITAAITTGSRAGQEIKLLASEAGALGRQKSFGQGLAVLERIQSLLSGAATPAAAPAAPGRFANHARVRLAWQDTRQKVQADLAKLEQAIFDHYIDANNVGELTRKIRAFDRVLETLDERLADTLDEAINAADTNQRARLHEQARRIVAEYSAFVGSDALVNALDGNPFVPLTTRATLLSNLQALDKSLA